MSSDALTAIANFADEYTAWLENEQAEAARHGHASDSQATLIEGWKFVADAMREWNASE